jgi:hypothetical protein
MDLVERMERIIEFYEVNKNFEKTREFIRRYFDTKEDWERRLVLRKYEKDQMGIHFG